MEISEELKIFINENIKLIDENTKQSWEELYRKLDYEIKSEFTKTILDAGINDPAKILGYLPDCYLHKSNITSYEIPSDVTSIGGRAFYDCPNLKNVIIPDSVTSIGKQAFKYCGSLTSVVIPSSVTSIGEEAFYKCSSLTSIEIPDSVISIGFYAFYDCRSLTEIVIPDSVTNIGYGVFSSCINLNSVIIPSSLTNIGDQVFRGCYNLKDIQFNGTKKQAIQCEIGDQDKKMWRRGSSIEKIICIDGEIKLN